MTALLLKKKLIKISRTDTLGYWLMYLKPSDSNEVQHNFFSLTTPWLRLLLTLIMLSIVHYPLGTMNLWTSLLMIITDQLKKEHVVAKVNWVDNSHIDPELSINVNNWMMKVWQLRVLSSFSWLKELNDIKLLAFSNVENWERNWVCMKKRQLYKLEECSSLYKKHIVNICSENNCTKIKAINDRIKEWNKDKKTVFCFMSPTNALILYWVCSTLLFTLKLQPQQL